MTAALEISCVVRQSDAAVDWWTIERETHDGRQWVGQTPHGHAFMCSSRLGEGDANVDIEGTAAEMACIADAIERFASFASRRCSVSHASEGFYLSSPRNSIRPVLVTHEVAKALAANIRENIR